jgi:REP element-mobilizing transposase RayT
MTTARSSQIDLEETAFYHITTRCVRRAFLCGEDDATGKSFDHRKLWLIERIKFLATVFAIEICAYAILSNHFHLILRVMADSVAKWDDAELIRRVRMLCPSCVQNIEAWADEERQQTLSTWRERLGSISWFMAQLNEYIARRANKEDNCKGRFWEGRFRSQALLDEGALLTCMTYVDLNPVRAGIAQGLDDSSWTSIRQRIEEIVQSSVGGESTREATEGTSASSNGTDLDSCPVLVSMEDDAQQARSESLPISFPQYMELLEWTGRTIRDDKKGHITAGPSQLLAKCGLDPAGWLDSVERFSSFGVFVGHPARLEEQAAKLGQQRLKGTRRASKTYVSAA